MRLAPLARLLLPLVSSEVALEQDGRLGEIPHRRVVGRGGEQRARDQRRSRQLLPQPGARGERRVHLAGARERGRRAEDRLVGERSTRVLVDEREQRAGLGGIALDGVRHRVRALLLDALQVCLQPSVRDEALVGEEAQRPVVDRAVVLAQVGDVEDQVRRVLGQLVLGMAEGDPGEVLLRLVQLAGHVEEAAQLEGDFHRVLRVRQRFQEKPAGAREQLLVRSERALRAVPVLGLLVSSHLGPGDHRAPGRPLQPSPRLLSGFLRGEVLPDDLFVEGCGAGPFAQPVEQLGVEEAQLVRIGRLREQREIVGVERLGGRVGVLEAGLLRLVVDLHRQVAQRLLRVLLRLLQRFAFFALRARGFLHSLERLHQGLRLAQQVLPLPAAGGDHQEPGLVQRGAGTGAVDLQQLTMDELRLGIAALVEEQLAILLEHLLARLRAELLAELLAGARRRADARVDQHVVAAGLPRELHFVRVVAIGGTRRIAAEADRHHLVQQLHGVAESVLVEAAPRRFVERVRIHVVGFDLGGGAVLEKGVGELRLVEEMLADEHVGRRRPGGLGEPPRQLARRRDGLVVLARILQRVGEEEERLVELRRARVFAEQLAIERDGLRARHLRERLVALRGGWIRIHLGGGAHGQRQAAAPHQIREPRRDFGLLSLASPQREQAAERTLLLLLLRLHRRIGAAVQERGIPPRLRERLRSLPGRGGSRGDGGGEGDGEDHGGPLPKPAPGGRTAPLPVPARCNLRARTAPQARARNRGRGSPR